MRRCAGRLVPILGAGLLLLLPAGAAHSGEPGRILPDPDGTGAVILRADGTIEHIDIGTGRTTTLRSTGAGARPAAIARPGQGTVVYALVPREDGRTTALEAHDVSGEAGPALEVKGRGRFLEVTEDGRFACIAGTKSGSQDEKPDRWILTVVDIATGEPAAPIPIGMVPTAMAVRGRDGILARLFVAGEDRVATFSMVPPRASWFYRSPGAHRDIALPASSAVVWLLRDDAFVAIDPQRWERDGGRVRSGTDDATTIVPLDRPAAALAMSPDGRFAAAIAQDGSSITLIDVTGGRIERTIDHEAGAGLAARVMAAPAEEGNARLLVASRQDAGSPPAWIDIPMPAAPEPAAVAASAPQPPAIPPAKPAPAGDAGVEVPASLPQASPKTPEVELPPEERKVEPAPAAAEEPPLQENAPDPTPAVADAPPTQEKVPEPAPAAAGAPPTQEKAPEPTPAAVDAPPTQEKVPEPTPAAADAPPTQEKAPEPPPAATDAPPTQEKVPEPTPAAAPAAPAVDPPKDESPPPQIPAEGEAARQTPADLSGRIQGEIPEGLQVLLYGPDNVLRLGARATVAPDGAWRLPMPAPGRYRIVVSAGPERHIFASPEYRTIVITGSGTPLSDIDFEIRGSIR